jgi:putative DNA primase/helicase
MTRDPDQANVEAFVAALFRRAGGDTFISLRAFDDTKNAPPLFIEGVKVGDPELIERVCARVAQAANVATPHVFCTPICTFQTAKGAKATDLAEGLALSAECDEKAEAARIKLTMLLGEPTVVVESGGQWLNPETKQPEPKLHLHWRLRTPTRTKEEHQKLRAARDAATQLVGGDASNKSIVHPMRWPGSWHCKAEPRLARIVGGDPGKEIDLDEALQKLSQGEQRKKTAKTGKKGAPGPPDMTQGYTDDYRTRELTRRAGWCLGPWRMSEGEAEQACLNWNQHNDPPLPENKVRKTVASIAQAEANKQTTGTSRILFYTDLGNARRLVIRHGANVRFIHEWKKWIIWNSNRWEVDNDGAVVRLAKETVTAMYSQALRITDSEKRDRLIGHALKSQAEPRLRAMVSLAESEIEVVLSAKALDANPWLLGVRNGVVELKTGEFRPGRREDFITNQAGVSYDPNAKCPEWLKFLNTIADGDKQLCAYLQRAVGYSLTGSVREEVMFVLWGTGNNGKSTFRETLHALHGEYALAADASLLTEQRTRGGATEEIARLKGRRFVAVNETNENDQLNEARVKFITSQDTMTGRYLYGHLIDFFPTHKTFLATNHKPIVRGTDEGIWRRVHLIPFTVTITKDTVEKDFRERRLMPELAGILNWAIEGVAAYLKEGLNPPQIVRAATDEYRQDMDVVGQWLEERCVCEPSASVPSRLAYLDYAAWAQMETGWTLSRLRWRRNLSDRGFGPEKGTHGRRDIAGLRLKSAGVPPMTGFTGGRPSPWAA